jgi:hypothetical protein
VEERRGGKPGWIRMEAREKEMPTVGKERRRQGEEKQRRRRNRIPQGLMHNFRKLQGPVCKA